MLALLRVAPVPLSAFDTPSAFDGIGSRSASRNGLFSLTKECRIDRDHPSDANAQNLTWCWCLELAASITALPRTYVSIYC